MRIEAGPYSSGKRWRNPLGVIGNLVSVCAAEEPAPTRMITAYKAVGFMNAAGFGS
jgi:hypothetical protein